jgi:non-canonical (house-cleaning) NTP pyrophosphatase
MRIGVTSKSELKVNAVRTAYAELGFEPEVIGYVSESGIGEQPVGDEALQGARNRIDSLGVLMDWIG